MPESTVELELRQVLAARTQTDPNDWYLVFKARYGMEVVFRALRDELGEGDVVTQLFTCLTAVAPIVAAGLRPRYAEISPSTLAVDPDLLQTDARTRAIVVQHTFGIIDPASDLVLSEIAHQRGGILVEDNAHCVGHLSRGTDGSPIADVSIHSFGVEKMLPGCYFGGAVWVNPALPNGRLRNRIRASLATLPELDPGRERAAAHYHNQLRLLTRLPSGASRRLRGRWESKGAFEPAVAESERRAELPLEPQRIGSWAADQALGGLASLDSVEETHRACVERYLEVLSHVPGVELPAAVLGPARNRPLLRLPVTLGSHEAAEEAISRVSGLGLYAVSWYRPLLLPGPLDREAFSWNGDLSALPVTARLSEGAVDLPCDVTPDQAEAAARAVIGT